jgi:cyclopropane fatty-acyl-phospholipid synthase-like methyltransferase
LLDIGGGHGMYSIAFCQQNLSLSATVFDSAEALKPAKINIAEAGLENAIQIKAGDFLEDDLGEAYDVALLFNICHGLSEEQNIALLNKTAKALNPGGMAVILEQLGMNLPMPMSRAANNLLGITTCWVGRFTPMSKRKTGFKRLGLATSNASIYAGCRETV